MMTYKRVGGLRFVRIGRFGFSFFWSKRINAAAERRQQRRERRNALLRGTPLRTVRLLPDSYFEG